MRTVQRTGPRELAVQEGDPLVATVCGDEIPSPKPAPDPYLRGAELAGFAPSDCVAVEDSPTGARSALTAGCTVFTVGPAPVLDGALHIGALSAERFTGLDPR